MKKDELRILEKLGRRVAEELGPVDSPGRAHSQRRAFQSLAAKPSRGGGRKRILFAAGATLVWGVLLFALLIYLLPPGMAFWVGDQTDSGTEGALLQAPASSQLPVRFSDGTQVILQGEAEGRIFASDRSRIRIVLGRGRILARVAKSTQSRWTVEAGPFRVTALGTEFKVSWSYEKRLLDVSVYTGKIDVKGPDVLPEGVFLTAGDHLRLTLKGGRVAMQLDRITPQPAPVLNDEITQMKPQSKDPDIAAAVRKRSPRQPKTTQPADLPGSKVAGLDRHRPETWQELYDLGRYAEAVRAAEKRGIDALLERLDDAQLWQLADSARFASRGDIAKKALIALRTRFRKSRRAKVAAFILGRMAAEIGQNPREACRWFLIYLRESPDGELAEESLGRCVQTCQQAGMPAEASRAARTYLIRYSDGVFREQAENLLKGERSR